MVSLCCAATDDVTAWCLLALVVGVVRMRFAEAAQVVAGAAVFLAVMFLAVMPLLTRLARKLDPSGGPLPLSVVAGTFLSVLMAGLATEAIGLHAMFGAFVIGMVVPHDSAIARDFTSKLKNPVTVLMLPAFFAYSGMRTRLGLIGGREDWLWCCAIILVATVGKLGGTMLAARLVGYSWRAGTALGILMNTRGLMALIVLNIGLDLGVISPTLFAMLVLMAVVTTIATAPILRWLVPDPTDGRLA
jgi:Kef-type K+ transport system membrane component KefB